MPESEGPQSRRTKAKHPKGSDHVSSRKPQGVQPTPGLEELRLPGLSNDFSQRTFERHAALLGDPRLLHPTAAVQRALLARRIQRDYGNRYVQRLVDHISQKRAEAVQTKLAVGPAGDEYEQEADRVAKQVVGMTEPSAQRQAGLEEEEMVRAKPDGSAQRQGEMEEKELQMKAGPDLLQRLGMEEEELIRDTNQMVHFLEHNQGEISDAVDAILGSLR